MLVSDIFTSGFFSNDDGDHRKDHDHYKDNDDREHHRRWWRDRDGRWCHD
jgi:hypothetical protein